MPKKLVRLPLVEERNSTYKSFPDTQWTLVLRANEGKPGDRQRALADLCQAYWPPVYAFIRSRGYRPHDAEDLTQGFFAQFLRRDDFEKTDPSKGRLRSYLLGAAKHFLTDEYRRESRQKRGGDVQVLSMNATEAEARCHIPEPADEHTPERIYARQWATTLLENVIQDLEARYVKENKEALFHALKPFIMPGRDASKQAEIAQELGKSDSAVRVAIHRLRQRYGVLLRETVAQTLSPEEDLDLELQQLMTAFS
jgi:RNA polymerase sigma-70 factor (ECF subfamily)